MVSRRKMQEVRGRLGEGRCGGGWGCRCTLLLGVVMATDAGEHGESLQRDGDHLLPTCAVGER